MNKYNQQLQLIESYYHPRFNNINKNIEDPIKKWSKNAYNSCLNDMIQSEFNLEYIKDLNNQRQYIKCFNNKIYVSIAYFIKGTLKKDMEQEYEWDEEEGEYLDSGSEEDLLSEYESDE